MHYIYEGYIDEKW